MKKSSPVALILSQKIKLDEIVYSVVGIDTYTLKNIFGKTKKWISYTLIDSKKRRTWISRGTAGPYFIQWTPLSEKKFKQKINLSIIPELSGIAAITFQGNQGFSLPNAEITWFGVLDKNYDYLAIERFLGLENKQVTPTKSYYLTGKILKNFQP